MTRAPLLDRRQGPTQTRTAMLVARQDLVCEVLYRQIPVLNATNVNTPNVYSWNATCVSVKETHYGNRLFY